MAAVSLESVSKVYPGGVRAVRDLRLHVRDGELLVLLGPSGCGKSTILRIIAGLEEPSSGELWLDDQPATDLPPRERNVAMVFQNGALYPHRSIHGNLAFPLELAGEDPAEIRAKVVELSRALQIDQALDRLPGSLSGGQRQRVAMGRAIIREPSVFLMDEPLSNLDAALRTDLRLEIGALVRGLGVTTVYVTHDQVEALTLADRIAVLRDGRLEDLGTPTQVYEDPATAFTAAFLGAPQINLLTGTVYAQLGEGSVTVDLGGQEVRLPWTDPRVEHLAHHHGLPVIVGVRADALRPVDEPDEGAELSGRLRALEYHGHEWLAHVETDVPVIDRDVLGAERREEDAAPRAESAVLDRVRSMLRRGQRRAEPEPATDHVGAHRRSDLVVRLRSGHGQKIGAPVRLALDVSRALFFGQDGHRIDPVQR
ncbi:ABC transporter ATP-binding protein [Actinomadura miaoliensis]|uniref:ABC transporter ATP-binding protein n=1 Tax=Actinomadura miaoliensis TaxID=430685 RepID=A0ABP7WU13_9ACTN